MNIITTIRLLYRAARAIAAFAGIVALVAWVPLQPWWLIAEVATAAVLSVACLYRILLAFPARSGDGLGKGPGRGQRPPARAQRGGRAALNSGAPALSSLRASAARMQSAVASAPPERFLVRAPKSATYTYVLTEGGMPVGVEYDKRAVDNWIGLGDDHDVIAHKVTA